MEAARTTRRTTPKGLKPTTGLVAALALLTFGLSSAQGASNPPAHQSRACRVNASWHYSQGYKTRRLPHVQIGISTKYQLITGTPEKGYRIACGIAKTSRGRVIRDDYGYNTHGHPNAALGFSVGEQEHFTYVGFDVEPSHRR